MSAHCPCTAYFDITARTIRGVCSRTPYYFAQTGCAHCCHCLCGRDLLCCPFEVVSRHFSSSHGGAPKQERKLCWTATTSFFPLTTSLFCLHDSKRGVRECCVAFLCVAYFLILFSCIENMVKTRTAAPSRAATVVSSRGANVARDIMKKRDKPYKTEQHRVLAKKRKLDIRVC